MSAGDQAAARARREAARQGAVERARELGHAPGDWQRIGTRMDAALCARCSRIVYVAVTAREGAIITGGSALEERCAGE